MDWSSAGAIEYVPSLMCCGAVETVLFFQWSFDVWSMSILLENPQIVTKLTHGGLVFREGHNQVFGVMIHEVWKKNISFTVTYWVLSQYTPTKKKMEKNWKDWGENVIHGIMHNPWVLIFTNYLIVPPSMQSLFNFSDLHCWDDNVRLTNQYANWFFRRNLILQVLPICRNILSTLPQVFYSTRV